MNLVENTHGTGAVWTPKDESMSLLKDVAMDTAPFDWGIGFDIEKKIGTIKIKDQGISSSCGGQAASYAAEIVHALNTGTYTPKSAKFIYAPIAYPGGGSTQPDISNMLMNIGAADESLCPSYENGNPPSEKFIKDKNDISTQAYENAKDTRVGTPVYVQRNIDSIAQAVRDHNWVIIGLYIVNNGTWRSKYPQPPTTPPDGTMPAHWMCVTKAEVTEGIKRLGEKQSWGDKVGDKGTQYIDATYMPYIWCSFTHADLAIPHGFSHRFTTQMKIGDSGTEVKALQQALKLDGEFPSSQVCTGYFGSLTQNAVNSFQIKYAKDILAPLALTKPTGRVGERTLLMLNSLYNH